MYLKSKKPSGSPQLSGEPLTQTIEHIYQSQCRGILGNETFDTVTFSKREMFYK
uniref:Uncharacterized protein n=1 Tax=Brassica oleracea TaxID=3712 RepID=A0A3P6FM71_BRAOL|nr:unnamed protein product [Brassica oleracea]